VSNLFDLDQGQLVAMIEGLEARNESLASINCDVEMENDELYVALDEALDLYEQAENDQCAIDYSDLRKVKARELRALTCETCALIAEGKTPGCLRHR